MKVTENSVTVDHCPNPDGSVAQTSWTFRDPEQAAAHIAQFEAGVDCIAERTSKGIPVYGGKEKISKGDASMFRDMANEAAKQRKS